MSKYSIAKKLIAQIPELAKEENLDRDEVLEALATTCLQDMRETRENNYTREYLQYELDCTGSGGVFEVQKR